MAQTSYWMWTPFVALCMGRTPSCWMERFKIETFHNSNKSLMKTVDLPFTLGEAQGPGEYGSVLFRGGVGGSLSRICSGTRSCKFMHAGTWCRLQGLRGTERLCAKRGAIVLVKILEIKITGISYSNSFKNINKKYKTVFLYKRSHTKTAALTHHFHFFQHGQPLTEKW